MKNLLSAAFAVSILSIPAHGAFVLGYQFGEGTGTTANDTADAPANNGTLLQGASFSTTSLSQTAGSGSLSLDGGNDYVSIDGVDLLRNVSSYTFAAFIRLDSLAPEAGNNENVIFFNNGDQSRRNPVRISRFPEMVAWDWAVAVRMVTRSLATRPRRTRFLWIRFTMWRRPSRSPLREIP